VPGDSLVYVDGGEGLIPIRQPYYMKDVTLDERFELVLAHTRAMVEAKGERRGVLEMRKHTQQYIKGIRGCKILRERLMHIETLEGVTALLAEYRASLTRARSEEQP
jgi:tRNA-dihydrouridine synthase